MNSKFIHFRAIIHYVTPFRQSIRICGSHHRLGLWNPLKGLRLEFIEGSYWLLDIYLTIDSLSVEYKFVECLEDENQIPLKILRWEEGGNRQIDFLKLAIFDGKHKRKDYWGYSDISIQEEVQLASDPAYPFLVDNSILVKGYVIDHQNKPIENVYISIEGTELSTSSEIYGFFEVRIPNALFPKAINANGEIILKAIDVVHTPNQTALSRKFVEREVVVLTLLPLKSVEGPSNQPLEKVIPLDIGELKLALPPNAYLDESGKIYNGEVKIQIAHLNADDPDQLKGFPTFKGKNQASHDVLIESKNAVFINIKDQNNRQLNVSGGSYVEIPVGQKAQGFSLWYINGNNQQFWTEISSNVTINGNTAVIPISNGGWYNVDRAMPISVFNGAATPFTRVTVDGYNYNSRFTTYSDQYGNFSLQVHSKGTFSIKTTQFEEEKSVNSGILQEKTNNYGPFNANMKFTLQELKVDKRFFVEEIEEKKEAEGLTEIVKEIDGLFSSDNDSKPNSNQPIFNIINEALRIINQNNDPKFKEIGNEIKFKIVSRSIDPKNEIPKKFVSIESGIVSGDYDVLKLNEKAERIHCALSDNVKVDNLRVNLDYNGKVLPENILMLSQNGNIIKPSNLQIDKEKTIFISDETKKCINAPNMGIEVKKLILDSRGNTGFVEESEMKSVDKNLDIDYVPNGSMINYRIFMIGLYPDTFKEVISVLKEKGFLVDFFGSIPSNFEELLKRSHIFILVSTNGKVLSPIHVNLIMNYYNNGGSLYILGDNAPYFGEANQILIPLFNTELTGNVSGDKFVGAKRFPNGVGFDENHPIFSGIQKLYEGVTVSYIENNNYQNLKPIMIGSDGKAIICCYENGKKRIVIDGGFTRMMSSCGRWNENGTNSRRFVMNIAGWLSKIDLLFK